MKRVKTAVKRQERREEGAHNEGFAALQLLHDPQVRAAARYGCCNAAIAALHA